MNSAFILSYFHICNIKLFVSSKLIQNLFHLCFFARFIYFCHHNYLISYITDCFDCKCSKNLQYFEFKNEYFHDNQQDLIYSLYNIILFINVKNNKFELDSLIFIIFCQRFKFFIIIKSHFFLLFEQNFNCFVVFIFD